MSKNRNQIRWNTIVGNIILWTLYVILFIYAVTLILALLWGLSCSFKDIGDYILHPFGFPDPFVAKNYYYALEGLYVPMMLDGSSVLIYIEELTFNSLVYSLIGALLQTMSVCFVAYAVAKIPNKFGSFLYWLAIILMVVPMGSSDLASTLRLYRTLNIYDNFIGIFVTKIGFLGFNFILFHTAFSSISNDYIHAAEIDGAGRYTILFRIMLPMVFNIISIVYLLSFVGLWNDWTTSYLFLPSRPTLSYALYLLQFRSGTMYSIEPVRLAACMIVCIPCFILFFLFRKQMMNSSLAIGGLKG